MMIEALSSGRTSSVYGYNGKLRISLPASAWRFPEIQDLPDFLELAGFMSSRVSGKAAKEAARTISFAAFVISRSYVPFIACRSATSMPCVSNHHSGGMSGYFSRRRRYFERNRS